MGAHDLLGSRSKSSDHPTPAWLFQILNRPVGTITTQDRWAIVDGDRMRMLTKEECKSAMGFPKSTRIPHRHHLAVHLLGNAVCPPVMAEVLRQVGGGV